MKLDIHNLYLLGLLIAIIVFLIVIYFELKTIQNNIKEISKPLNSQQIPNNTLPGSEKNAQVLESVEFLDLDKLEDLESNNSKDKNNIDRKMDSQIRNINNTSNNTINTNTINNNTSSNLNLDDESDDEDEDNSDDVESNLDDLDNERLNGKDGGEDESDGDESDGDESDGDDLESLSINEDEDIDSQELMEKINNSQENDIDEMDEETQIEMEKKRVLNTSSLKELKKMAASYKIVQKGTKDELIDRLVKSSEFDLKKYIENQNDN
tara:strand:- start:2401 stop:3201 length:801 start_codon:yes stop_codon:yes gene_type:complete